MKMKRGSLGFLSMLIACVSILVSLPTEASASKNTDKHTPTSGSHQVHWAYSGAEGPDFWGSLSGDYLLCGAGKQQSPINVAGSKTSDMYALQFRYRANPVRVVNNGHTIKVGYNSLLEEDMVSIAGKDYPIKARPVYDSSLLIGPSEYRLLQFHFHTPSEHNKNGKSYPMEVHLVHQNSNKALAVVGVFIAEGQHNPQLQQVLDNASSQVGVEQVKASQMLLAADLLPQNKAYYHYDGSLTTPPCSEQVRWFVMADSIEASASQLRQFASLMGHNARPLQKRNWRELKQVRR